MTSSTSFNASKTTRNLSLDALKVVMAVMVIGLHGGFLRDVSSAASSYFTNGLFRIAVPTFLIINGYYLERQLDRGAAGWFGRMLLMYGVWMALYAPLWLVPERGVQALAGDVALGFYHLWYLVALILAALLVWLLRPTGSRGLGIAVAVTFAAGLGMQYAGNFHLFPDPVDNALNRVNTYRNFLFFGFPFLGLGVLLARHEAVVTPRRAWRGPLLVGALLLLSLEWAVNYTVNRANSVFEIYLSLALVCPLLFLTVKGWDLPGTSKTLGTFATAVYLVHIWVLHFTYDVEMQDTARTLIGLAVSAALAPLLVLANRRLPLL